nr:circadian clock-controlled protein daywake-like [Helicoverpa armigera]
MYKLTVQGIPKLNIESLEPMHHDVIDGDLAVLKYRLFNTTVEGSTKCEVVDAKLDLQKTKLNLAMFCPLFHMYGLYEISGKILVMPIEGKGDFKMECKDYYIQVDSDIKISQGKNGKKYISFKSYKTKGDLQGGMIIEINNLFNGRQKELADDINRFINKNWKPVANELQGPVFNANMRILVKNFNKYLKSIPLDELILGVD